MHIVWHKNLHACGCFSMCLHWKLPWGQHYTCCMSSWGVLWCGMCTKWAPKWVCEEDLWKFMFATVSCTTSWLLLLPSCPHCLLFSSTWFFLYSLSLSVDANMFLVVVFFLSALSFLSYPRFKSQNNVESFHSNATLSLTPISNRTQICFFRSVHLTQTVTLPVWWTHTQTHTHILKDSKSVCLETCQPEGCDIVVRDPKEVDNSTASGMLCPEGKN